MNSAFGVDHGEISKARDRKKGAAIGAGVGVAASGAQAVRGRGELRSMVQYGRNVGLSGGKAKRAVATGALMGAGVNTAFGAGIGAAIGTKKKKS